MSTINNGGTAFPVITGKRQISEHEWEYDYIPGMSLRDYFAAKAMPVILLAALQGCCKRVSNSKEPLGPDDYALAAYGNADAMLKAREVKP